MLPKAVCVLDQLTPITRNESVFEHLSDLKPVLKQSNDRKYGEDVRKLVKLVCMAFLNPSGLPDLSLLFVAYYLVNIPWDVEEYYLECIKGKKDPKRIGFPNPQFGIHSEPLTVVDSRGRIVLWYLPGLLSGRYEVSSALSHCIMKIS